MKTCPACGAEMPDGTQFCTECGAPLSDAEPIEVTYTEEEAAGVPMTVADQGEGGAPGPQADGNEEPQTVTAEPYVPVTPTLAEDSRVIHTADGKYRWVYEEKMLLDFEYLMKWLKGCLAIGCAGLIAWIVLGVMAKKPFAQIYAPWKTGCWILLALVLIPVIMHVARAAREGWKRVYIFEMDDKGFINAPQEKGVSKDTAEDWIRAMVGLSQGSTTTTGQGFLQATQNIKKTSFDKVKSVQAMRSRHQITVKETFTRNELLVEDRDMDFVWSYVTSRCKRAKVR